MSRMCHAIRPTTAQPEDSPNEGFELLPVLLAQEVGDGDIRSQVGERSDAILGDGGMHCMGILAVEKM